MSEDNGKVNLRHLRGFRRFQNAALKALSVAVSTLKTEGMDGDTEKQKEKPLLKVGYVRSLVSAYKDAVAAERSALGMEGSINADIPDQYSLRWVVDKTAGPGGVKEA